MKLLPVALIVLLAIALQGSGAITVGMTPLLQSDCQTSSESRSDTSQKPCCPGAALKLSCCLGASIAAAALPMTPRSLAWQGRTAPTPQFRTTIFSSRGDSPLTRPPIL